MTNDTMDKRDMKIELRAVVYVRGNSQRVLEYRISPDQDTSVEVEPANWWERLEKKLFPDAYKVFISSEWKQPIVFFEHPIMGQYDYYDDFNWGPVWVNSESSFNKMKENLKTYGQLRDWLDAWNEKGRKNWEKEWKECHKDIEPWY